MLTGLRNDVLATFSFDAGFRKKNPKVKTLPSLLRSEGYDTVSVGKVIDDRLFYDKNADKKAKMKGKSSRPAVKAFV